MPIIDLNGVSTWYDEHGSGEPLVLFHPGGVDSRALGPHPLAALAAEFRVFTPGASRSWPHPRHRRPLHVRDDC
jgi:hypothetical protein